MYFCFEAGCLVDNIANAWDTMLTSLVHRPSWHSPLRHKDKKKNSDTYTPGHRNSAFLIHSSIHTWRLSANQVWWLCLISSCHNDIWCIPPLCRGIYISHLHAYSYVHIYTIILSLSVYLYISISSSLHSFRSPALFPWLYLSSIVWNILKSVSFQPRKYGGESHTVRPNPAILMLQFHSIVEGSSRRLLITFSTALSQRIGFSSKFTLQNDILPSSNFISMFRVADW